MRQYEIPGALRLETTPGGLTRAVITTEKCSAEVYLQGAHVTQWKPQGAAPVLFLSSTSQFAPGKAIRGGIPVIYPWFGARSDGQPGPAHGFARTTLWTLDSTALTSEGEVEMTMSLPSSEFPGAQLRLGFGKTLRMEFEVRNESSAPVTFEEALHTYFALGSILETSVTGLENTVLIDKTDGMARKNHGSQPVRCARETDQVHLNTSADCTIRDSILERRIVVEKTGSRSTIVWNPWSEKAAAMSDLGSGEWQQMICVESGNAADNAIALQPGQAHVMTVRLRLE